MVKLKTIFWLVDIITIFLSYILATTFTGAFHAWLTKKMGDTTAYFAGYQTLNPLAHIDWLGLFCFCFLGIGWDKMIPVDTTSIAGRFRRLKIVLAESGTCIAYFFIAFIGTTLLRIFLPPLFMRTVYKTALYALSFAEFSLETNPLLSATGVVFSYLITASISVCLILGCFDLIRLMVTWVLRILQHKRYVSLDENVEIALYINFITLMTAIFVLVPLKLFIMFIIAKTSMVVTGLLGL